MPAYDYRCLGCGRVVEVRLPMSHAGQPVQVHYACDALAERVYEPVASCVKGGTPQHHDRAWLRGAGGQGNSIRREP